MSRTGPKISRLREALQNFQQAISIDESFAAAYGMSAYLLRLAKRQTAGWPIVGRKLLKPNDQSGERRGSVQMTQ
jgi:hypothetical protein